MLEGGSCDLRIQLIDSYGRPLAHDDISAAELTLYDLASGTVINSRSAQDVLDANGGALAADLTITAATRALPCVLTCTGHGLLTGNLVHLSSVGGMNELNGRVFAVERLSDSTFALAGVDSRNYTTYTSGGTGRIGLLTIHLSALDNVIVGTVPSNGWAQTHRAEVIVTYGAEDYTVVVTKDYEVSNTKATA